MKQPSFHLKFLAVLLLFRVSYCSAQTLEPTPLDSQVTIDEQIKRVKARRQVRIREAWTGNDQPYIRIRQQIDQAIARKSDIKQLAKQAHAQAQSNPKDAQAQFRWGYAALKAAPLISEKADPLRGLKGVADAMWGVASPKSYQFDRVAFLVESFNFLYLDLRPLGERLLERNPKDLDVIYAFIPLLKIAHTPTDRQRAILYVQTLRTAQPQNLDYLAREGYVYFVLARFTSREEYRKKAVEAYQKIVNNSPRNSPRRSHAQSNIDFLTKYKKLYNKY